MRASSCCGTIGQGKERVDTIEDELDERDRHEDIEVLTEHYRREALEPDAPKVGPPLTAGRKRVTVNTATSVHAPTHARLSLCPAESRIGAG